MYEVVIWILIMSGMWVTQSHDKVSRCASLCDITDSLSYNSKVCTLISCSEMVIKCVCLNHMNVSDQQSELSLC